MSRKILSISIAAYNVEKFITQTLDSLIVPHVLDYLEVFVIDDGGTDGTLDIAKQYEKKYPQTFHTIHKENGGYGSTVNYSIQHAAGKYFKLLDGDDWFDSRELEQLIYKLDQIESDIVVTNYYKGEDEKSLKIVEFEKEVPNKLIRLEDYAASKAFGMWSIVYKTELLRKSNLILPEKMFYTDQIYATIPFAHAKNIIFYDLPVYCYRIGRDGQSISRESRIKHIDETKAIFEILCKYYEKEKARNNPNCSYLQYRIAKYYLGVFKTFLLKKVSKKNLDEIKDYESKTKCLSEDIYEVTCKDGKAGKLLVIFRKTNYLAYWLLRLLPKGFPNWS